MLIVLITGCGKSEPGGAKAAGKQTAASNPGTPEALRAAIEKGDVQAALAGIAAGANVTEMYNGEQPLHMAAKSGKKEIVEAILEKGVDPKVSTQRGYTALHMASSRDVADLLVQKGLDVNQTSTYRQTPLCMAADAGNLDVVEYLLSKGASLQIWAENGDMMPLNYAATRAIAEKLVAVGAQAWGETNKWGRNTPPLWSAAAKGRTEVVAFLLEKGIPPPPSRGLDEYITRALFNAVNGKHSDVVDIILGKVKNVDARKCSEYMSLAAKKSDTNMVHAFLTKGPRPDDNYTEALISAAGKGDAGILKLILDAGGNAGAATSVGYTPVHAAAAAKNGPQENYLACLELLLARGADAKTQKKGSSLTPLHLAAAANFTTGADFLIRHGADVNALDEVSAAPLHWAVINDAVDVATLLLSKGANPNLALSNKAVVQTTQPWEVPNPFGGKSVSSQTPLTLVKSTKMRELLQKNGATETAATAPAISTSPKPAPVAPPVAALPPAHKSAGEIQPPVASPVPATKKIKIGDTEEAVISALGSPKGRMKAGGETILQYKGGEVTIAGGKVSAVSGQPTSK